MKLEPLKIDQDPKPYSMFAEVPEAAHAMKFLADSAVLRGSVDELQAILEVQRGIHQLIARVRTLQEKLQSDVH